MSEFTKGEWDFCETPIHLGKNKNRSLFFLVGSHERAIGFIRHKDDARLIAAAPEMYGELYEALQLLKGKSSYNGDEFSQQAESIQELLARIDSKDAQS